jgi:hypothetical protein
VAAQVAARKQLAGSVRSASDLAVDSTAAASAEFFESVQTRCVRVQCRRCSGLRLMPTVKAEGPAGILTHEVKLVQAIGPVRLSARANGMAAIASASSVRPNTITGIL